METLTGASSRIDQARQEYEAALWCLHTVVADYIDGKPVDRAYLERETRRADTAKAKYDRVCLEASALLAQAVAQ